MSLPPHYISSGGLVSLSDTQWTTVGSILYPGDAIDKRGDEVKKVWLAAMAGDTSVGLDLVLEDQMGNAVAGPSTTYGGSALQLNALVPLRTAMLRKTGPPQVLVLRARNRAPVNQPAQIGQLSLECNRK